MPERPRALLEAANEDPRAAKLPLLKRLMEFVLHHDEPAYLARTRELAFLANTLLAGSSVQSRPFTPQEASDAAACICNLGLECGPAPRRVPRGSRPRDGVRSGLVGAVPDVSLFVADQLISTLTDIDCRRRRHPPRPPSRCYARS